MPSARQLGIVLSTSMVVSTPSFHLLFLGMSRTSQVVAVQEMVDQKKAALESAKSNLTVAQI